MEEEKKFKYTPKYTFLVLSIMISIFIILTNIMFLIALERYHSIQQKINLGIAIVLSIIAITTSLFHFKNKKITILEAILISLGNGVAFCLEVFYIFTATKPV